MSFTVVPLHNLDLPKGTQIPFGKGFFLTDMPEWLPADKNAMGRVSDQDRVLTKNASHALVAEYEADSWAYPDPDWKGMKPKPIQRHQVGIGCTFQRQ
jgi:hypothetical protein